MDKESGLSCMLCSGSHKAADKVSSVFKPCGCQQHAVPCGLGACWLLAGVTPSSWLGGPPSLAAGPIKASKGESLGARWQLQLPRTIREVTSGHHACCILLVPSQPPVPPTLKGKETHSGMNAGAAYSLSTAERKKRPLKPSGGS